MKKCRKYSTGVFLGRKLSYFPPAGGSGKKNSQTQISNSQTQISNLQTQISNLKIFCRRQI